MLINAQGLKGGKRGKLDGCCVIGSRGKHSSGLPLNDYEICEDNSAEDRRFMKINYVDKKYFLRDLGDGNGTFVKIDKPMTLKNGYIISFGDSHMSVNFYQERQNRTNEKI